MTAASAAGFPPPDYDAEVRRAYRGGFTWVNPRFRGRMLGAGIVLDVNSLYPSIMAGVRGELLPYGDPRLFSGEPPESSRYPLWVAHVTLDCTLKPDHIPCIQVKEGMYSARFNPTDYIEDTKGRIERWFTNVDLDLIRDQYDINYLEFHGGFLFKGSDRIARPFVEGLMRVKAEARREGNEGRAYVAKNRMNSSYGKMGTNPIVGSKRPYLREDGSVGYADLPKEERSPVYIPYAVFVTAWGRDHTIRAAQDNFDRFVYADTDSIHLVGTDVPEGLDVDPVRMGAWALETEFTRAKFLRAKTYLEEVDHVGTPQLHIHCAGLPERCFQYDTDERTAGREVPEGFCGHVEFGNFEIGTRYWGKLRQVHVPGGVVLEDSFFTVRG